MTARKLLLFVALAGALLAGLGTVGYQLAHHPTFISYRVDLRRNPLNLYWENDHHQRLRSLQGLKSWLTAHHQKLVFAMNGGMFKPG